jgi:hypothetical protein
MSEERSMAEDILDGIFCEECGQYIGDSVGHPIKCLDCKLAHKKPKQKPVKVCKGTPRTNFGG